MSPTFFAGEALLIKRRTLGINICTSIINLNEVGTMDIGILYKNGDSSDLLRVRTKALLTVRFEKWCSIFKLRNAVLQDLHSATLLTNFQVWEHRDTRARTVATLPSTIAASRFEIFIEDSEVELHSVL